MMDFLLSDFDSSSESGSCEDQDDSENLYGGQANSILSSLEESIRKIDDFLLFERGFIHGDIVCSINDPSRQMGRVVNVEMLLDLENTHGKTIKNVNSKELKRYHSISVGDYVVHGPWLGKVDKIVDCVSILFDDGSECEFTMMGPEKVLPISPDLLEDTQYSYYPGQRVRVELPSVSKSARWLRGTWKAKQDEGTVCSVKEGLVCVDWLGFVLFGCERVPAPSCLQDSKNLTSLSCFSHTNWQLGDWCILPVADHNDVMETTSSNASTCEPVKEHKQSEKEFQGKNLIPNFQEIFVTVKKKTKVDVLWQDGSLSFGLDSQYLFPINIVDAHDFWPEQFVLEKGSCDDDPHVPSNGRWGVVRSVDAKEKTVKVKWETFEVNRLSDLEGKHMEETVSAYELIEHPDYSYCFGDIVFRLEKSQLVDQLDEKNYKSHVFTKMEMGEEAALKGMNCGRDHEFPSNSYLSCIGIVMGLKDGEVEVKWATGLTTKVAPYEIIQLDKFEGSSASRVLNGGYIEQWNQETEHDKHSLHQKGKGLLAQGLLDFSFYSLPRAAIGFFTSITASLFSHLVSASLPGTSGPILEDAHDATISEKSLESCNLCTEGPPTIVGDLHTLGESKREIGENEAFLFSSGNKHSEEFRQFDMVSGCYDHYFVDGAGKGLTFCQMKRSWLKKVRQEWSILEKDLPESIYVRLYEDRMDLLRAAIIGAPGTPYHDGLFFFDIFLPPEYPHEPPLVHYNSGGLRINPNLYESGKVCLSLLNTWTGTSSEVWNPESSTLLQVLLSLQALVLNEKPYFNEAGYDELMGRAEGEKNSVSYNENAFLVSCKSILYLLKKPPKHFEALVEEHFSRRFKHILSACKAYMEGAPVGCDFGCEKTEQENQLGSSTGFKIMLAKLFPRLVEAFSDKGIDCSQFY